MAPLHVSDDTPSPGPAPRCSMKKMLILAVAAVGGFAAYRKLQADRAEQDLWTEATTSSDLR